VALDAVACWLIGLNPEYVPTSVPGEVVGLGTYHRENIEVLGGRLESFVDETFDVVRKPPVSVKSGAIRTFLKNQICPRPVINELTCTRCGICIEVCPANTKAIDWHCGDKSKPPVFNYSQCVHCFCCQELCPEGAIAVKDMSLAKIFFR
jgi:formate hydrogenlyase subunit 6/NADH:ubiquinone oxidoreductase subunit I